jgi:membrane protein
MSVIDKAKSAPKTARKRAPWLDHFIRAFARYTADGGNRLAAAVTYFGFLSFFPLVALAFAALGYVVGVYPDARAEVEEALESALPGLVGPEGAIDLDAIADASATVGVVGLLGLLYAGTGMVDALREAVRSIWHQNVLAGNIVVKKLKDVGILIGLGAVLLLSLAVTGLTSTVANELLGLVGIEDSPVAGVFLAILGPVLAFLVDVVLFIYLFTGLPKVQTPFRQVLKGAVFAAVGFEILKLFGAQLIAGTVNNPVYGTFGIVVGLLVWIYFVSRLVVFAAAWTVTAPYDSDVPPSGTSSPEAAREAGIPEEYADDTPHSRDEPPVLHDDGAPTPLRNVVEGRTPPQDAEEGRGSLDGEGRAERARRAAPLRGAPGGARAGAVAGSASSPSGPSRGDGPGTATATLDRPGTAAATRPAPGRTSEQLPGEQLPGEQRARLAARIGLGAVGFTVAGVILYAGSAVRDLVRR